MKKVTRRLQHAPRQPKPTVKMQKKMVPRTQRKRENFQEVLEIIAERFERFRYDENVDSRNAANYILSSVRAAGFQFQRRPNFKGKDDG